MSQKPKLGQNFLQDHQAIQRIADALGDLTGRTVVEIGPGAGAITGALAARAGKVVAVELDPRLAEHLRQEFAGKPVEVVHQDCLEFDLAALAEREGQKLLVAGNLPYGITSQILLKLTANHQVLDRAVLMVQREVADRVAAGPGSRDYGVLSVTVQMAGPVCNLFTLPPEAFMPPPDVFSTVFVWRFAARWAELDVTEESFLRLAKQAFAQKRKTLGNNLRAAGYSAPQVAGALDSAGVSPGVRAEALGLEELARVARALRP